MQRVIVVGAAVESGLKGGDDDAREGGDFDSAVVAIGTDSVVGIVRVGRIGV